ncbi:craniofacial development 2-like [Brachionus plicatilis]|uniref:Craniofacial development 2-like n=1 Tax=Brachionus plicatilis TaxID=10195 RepID=A0A3M7SRU4_BRAPC|nr:craniofacial development 2-like [Brachionus plicatilis]
MKNPLRHRISHWKFLSKEYTRRADGVMVRSAALKKVSMVRILLEEFEPSNWNGKCAAERNQKEAQGSSGNIPMAEKTSIMTLETENLRGEYSTKLRKSLKKLEHQEESDIQRRWSEIREAYCKTAEEVLGFIKHHRKRWISDETWALIAERGEIKAKMLQAKSNRIREKLEASYGIKNRLVKKGARRDKRNYINQCEASRRSRRSQLKRGPT